MPRGSAKIDGHKLVGASPESIVPEHGSLVRVECCGSAAADLPEAEQTCLRRGGQRLNSCQGVLILAGELPVIEASGQRQVMD